MFQNICSKNHYNMIIFLIWVINGNDLSKFEILKFDSNHILQRYLEILLSLIYVILDRVYINPFSSTLLNRVIWHIFGTMFFLQTRDQVITNCYSKNYQNISDKFTIFKIIGCSLVYGKMCC